MVNIIIIALLVILEGLAVAYLYRSKKKGKTCIGCPYNGSCGKKSGEACCSSSPQKK
ncbi:MAG: FeoB-associated Cys-rich membrane protein [Lachnospiraceae bacterium]|nr:FeoB-associated Cys-rich membrane protein [Lachnospiraceae bacterium]